MNIPRKFPSRYEVGAVRQNIYTVGAVAAAFLTLMAAVRVVAWVTRSLLAVLAIFFAVSYIAVRIRGDRRFARSVQRA